MIPSTTFPLVTTRAPMFFTRNQSAALITLASGSIVTTSVPFCLRMVSMLIAASPELAAPRRLASNHERAPFRIDWQRGSKLERPYRAGETAFTAKDQFRVE